MVAIEASNARTEEEQGTTKKKAEIKRLEWLSVADVRRFITRVEDEQTAVAAAAKDAHRAMDRRLSDLQQDPGQARANRRSPGRRASATHRDDRVRQRVPPNDTVEQITGSPSRRFRDFALRNTTTWLEAS